MAPNILLARVSDGGGYTANAVEFDGTNDALDRGGSLTGLANGKEGTISFWANFRTDNEYGYLLNTASNYVQIRRHQTDGFGFQVVLRNAANTVILNAWANTTITAAMGWVHCTIAWNLATPEVHIYIDDTDFTPGTPNTLTDDTIGYTTPTDWFIGGASASVSLTNMYVADLWFDTQFIDISVEANRRKFIDASGKPVDLGSDGSTPTGSAPIIFQSGATSDWHTNKGTGGGFTENGTLTDAPSSPSD